MALALPTVAETSEFVRDADAERMSMVAREGAGKSGGYRVLTAYVGPQAPVYLLAVPSKSDRANFAAQEVRDLAKLTSSIKLHWQQRRRERGMSMFDLGDI